MKPEWISAYLERINFTGSAKPRFNTLVALHRAHLLSVPFEDLDIHYGRRLSLELPDLYSKVVVNNRGGFCYELNHLFGLLLEVLGFQVTRVAAQVFDEKGHPGPYYDHMTLLVELDGTWLADVGFGGGSFLSPLSLSATGNQHDAAGIYRINNRGPAQYQLLRAQEPGDFRPMYEFDQHVQDIESFAAECLLKQTSKDSHFVRNKICTLATDQGRISLVNDSFSYYAGKEKKTIPVTDPQLEKQLLWEHFRINI